MNIHKLINNNNNLLKFAYYYFLKRRRSAKPVVMDVRLHNGLYAAIDENVRLTINITGTTCDCVAVDYQSSLVWSLRRTDIIL